ncbi:hypothetical protein, partial [Sphingomonas bacterium]|uniref:hypothetical protein n=1 Tax=Sphingomonas bacterium TaxID=1895847 RepID=UPI0015759C15
AAAAIAATIATAGIIAAAATEAPAAEIRRRKAPAFFAEAVALVPTTALTAPPSIKTHAAEFFPTLSPYRREAAGDGRGRSILGTEDTAPILQRIAKRT